jgi:hypothetical protein
MKKKYLMGLVVLFLLPASIPNTLSAQQPDATEMVKQYSQVPEGPTYAARTTLKIPAKELEAKIENFDFLKQ